MCDDCLGRDTITYLCYVANISHTIAITVDIAGDGTYCYGSCCVDLALATYSSGPFTNRVLPPPLFLLRC